VRFGAFELDVPAHELRKAGIRLRVPDQSVQILSMLLEHPGEVVPREVIRERLWPNGTVVEFEHSVGAAMNRLRSALGDSAGTPKYIETLPKRGYRFVGEVEVLEPPPEAAHYRVLGEAGRGGMGVVYRAEDVQLSRTVALKVLPEEMRGDASAFERLRREARILASLNHPGICTIYGIDECGGRTCLVMEWMDGQPLSAIISQGRALPANRVIEIAEQVLDALAAAHTAGVIHRDVKPENIFLVGNGKTKLLDF
jgi:eukaryotic-like serine/threonine-protein kinase